MNKIAISILAPALALALALALAKAGSAYAAASPETIAETAARRMLDPAIVRVADALGMIRGVGANESVDLVNRAEFTAAGRRYIPVRGGAWAEQAVRSLTFGVSYRMPASRVDSVLVAGGGEQRSIEVFREGLAWNETEPGVGGAPAPQALEERRRQVLLLPHGFMRAVLQAPAGSVRVTREGEKTVIVVPAQGVMVKGAIGASAFPERIEMPVRHPVLGATTLAASYSGYKDWDGYEVFFPSRIVQTLGGRTVADLTVTQHLTGPYIVWPVPPAMRPAAR